MPSGSDEYRIFRNACPRNCYDTCSIKTYVKDGRIAYIEGAPENTFTNGGLCVKGYAYINRVYSPERVLYPLQQTERGSGNFKRITWDSALDQIARKIKQINTRDGSLHGLCLATGSGNHGVTNNSPDGMMASLGFTTRTVGTPCWPAGIDAQTYDMGDMWCNDPEDMGNSRYIILWGANPAWCSIHTMKYIYQAREKGARIVTIDPILTQTAAKSDLHLPVKTGTDGLLALAMAKHILDSGLEDKAYIGKNTLGFRRFKQYLDSCISIGKAAKKCGIAQDVIRRVATAYAETSPATIWIGYGMQRHTNGGANVRAIDTLGVITGNIGQSGGGVRYGHLTNRIFNYFASDMPKPENAGGKKDRHINTNKLAKELLTAKDPPIRMLWNTCRNPMSQDFDRPLLKKAFEKLEMIVCVDQFITDTARYADIILPVTTLFEEDSVNVAYWHYWISLNEKAIEPLGEARSNTQIAMALSEKMNELHPGSCTFPVDLTPEQWIEKEFNPQLYEMYGINSWEELKKGPVKARISTAAWPAGQFSTPSGKYEFFSEQAQKDGHTALPEVIPGRIPDGPFRLLTPHSKFSIHSQFQNLENMAAFNPEPYVGLHPAAARRKGIKNGDMARVFNAQGSVTLRAKISTTVPENVLVMHELWFNNKSYCVQELVDDESADMGAMKTGAPGVAIHDQFADIEKAGPKKNSLSEFWKKRK